MIAKAPKLTTNFLTNCIHVMTAVLFAAVIAAYVCHYLQPAQRFFSYNEQVGFIPLKGLDEPNVSTKALLRWATLAATTAYTINFFNYDEILTNLQSYFTVEGFENFQQAINQEGFLDQVIADKLMVSAVNSIRPTPETPSATPVILKEGVIKGRYTWKIQLPLLLTFQGSSERSTARYFAVTMLVSRVPTTEAQKGIGIAQFSVRTLGL